MKFLTAIFLGLCLVSCKDDDDPQLPAATRQGKNTFGCLIDGKVMVPGGSYGGIITEVSQSGYVWISASNFNTKQVLNMEINRDDVPLEEGVRYEFNNPGNITCRYNVYRTEAESCMYDSAPVKGGITFTEINWDYNIISGTFDFEVYSDECGKSVSVTEGRFDVFFSRY